MPSDRRLQSSPSQARLAELAPGQGQPLLPIPWPWGSLHPGLVPESPMSMEEGMLRVLKSRFSLLPPLTCRGFYKVSTLIARPEIDSLVSLNDS